MVTWNGSDGYFVAETVDDWGVARTLTVRRNPATGLWSVKALAPGPDRCLVKHDILPDRASEDEAKQAAVEWLLEELAP